MNPWRLRLAGLAAGLALLALLAGLPAVLIALGWGRLPAGNWWIWLSAPDDGRLAVLLLKAAAWVVWALLAVVIAAEIIAMARAAHAPRLPGLRWSQPVAHRLVATAILLFTTIPAAANVAAATPAAAAPAVDTGSAQPSAIETPTEAAHEQEATTVEATHTVRHGDSLWSIAERHLGSGRRYPEIARLNSDLLGGHDDFLRPGWVLRLPVPDAGCTYVVRPGDTLSGIARTHLGDETAWPAIYEASTATRQPGGGRLTDPDLILPGWRLTLPGHTAAHPNTTPSQAAPAQPAPAPAGTSAPSRPAQGSAPAPAQPAAPASPPVPAASPEASPEATPAASTAAPALPEQSETAPADSAPWLLPGLVGAGSILAGGLYVALQRRRRAQFRARRPGRAIAAPTRDLAGVEKTLRHAAATVPTIDRLDAALRSLPPSTEDGAAPALRAVELLPGAIAVHLAEPNKLNAPWRPADHDGEATRWLLDGDEDLPEQSLRAPYPLLVSMGKDADGHSWLVNLERLGVVSLTGDPVFVGDFARYLAAEIAVNPWSRDVRLDAIGIAAELADLDPARLRIHAEGEADAALRSTQDIAEATISRCDVTDLDAATGRADDAADELWATALLIVDARHHEADLDALLDRLQDQPGRTGAAVVLVSDEVPIYGAELTLTGDGRVHLPEVGPDLLAVGLTSDEARGCALLLAQADNLTDEPMPTDGDDGWREASDAAGSLRDELVLSRDTDPDGLDEDADSLLPEPDDHILSGVPATADDLKTLAPLVPAHVRTRVEASDDQLDVDVAAWFDTDQPHPRLSLLGPVHATMGAGGDENAASKRRAFYTEILAFLALHPSGVTTDQLVDAFNLEAPQIRKHLAVLRSWLGSDPATGQPYLPSANDSPNAKTRGMGVYQLMGVLVDVDLFRRLRLRGEARASEGLPDLRRALNLVEGEPFTGLRAGGWEWLVEGTRHDQHMVCAVVDVAHAVALASLHRGDVAAARTACEIAILAAPYEDTPQVDLAAVLAREGDPDAAQRLIVDNVCNRTEDDDAPADLDDRTSQLIRERRWLTTGDKVA